MTDAGSMTDAAARDESNTVGASRPFAGALAVVLLVLLYYAIQFATLRLQVWPLLGLPESATQHGNWAQISDHHLWQMLLAIGVIAVFARGRIAEWGLNLRKRDVSMRVLRRFMLYYGVYFVGIGFVVQLLFTSPPGLPFPATTLNVAGMLAFTFLLSGLSEEILFRGLMHTYLLRFFGGLVRVRGIEIPVAGIITAIIFTLVHINFRIAPLTITHLYLPQLVLAFVLGIYYSAVYHRTGSLLNPILAHNFSNGTLYLSSLALAALT